MPTPLAIILVFSVLGIINALYLSYHTIRKTPVKCFFFKPEWCQKVQSSKFSKTFGIPNSFAGLFFFTSILVLSILFWQGQQGAYLINTTITVGLLLNAAIFAGFLFSLYFTFIQAFVLKAFCTWCVFSAIDFTVLFIAVRFI